MGSQASCGFRYIRRTRIREHLPVLMVHLLTDGCHLVSVMPLGLFGDVSYLSSTTDLIDKIMEVFMEDFTVYGRNLMTVWPILGLFYSVVLKLIWYSIGRSVISWFKRVFSSVIWFPREELRLIKPKLRIACLLQ